MQAVGFVLPFGLRFGLARVLQSRFSDKIARNRSKRR
jgi:hypothetical protein